MRCRQQAVAAACSSDQEGAADAAASESSAAPAAAAAAGGGPAGPAAAAAATLAALPVDSVDAASLEAFNLAIHHQSSKPKLLFDNPGAWPTLPGIKKLYGKEDVHHLQDWVAGMAAELGNMARTLHASGRWRCERLPACWAAAGLGARIPASPCQLNLTIRTVVWKELGGPTPAGMGSAPAQDDKSADSEEISSVASYKPKAVLGAQMFLPSNTRMVLCVRLVAQGNGVGIPLDIPLTCNVVV
jgi:hypothetical protein